MAGIGGWRAGGRRAARPPDRGDRRRPGRGAGCRGDVAGTFEPQLSASGSGPLSGVDGMVLSLPAKGLIHGEFSAPPGQVYGASVSKQMRHTHPRASYYRLTSHWMWHLTVLNEQQARPEG